MSLKLYPALKGGLLNDQAITDNAIAGTAEGYAFPTISIAIRGVP